jgi:methyl-accepting chemotaxis protein
MTDVSEHAVVMKNSSESLNLISQKMLAKPAVVSSQVSSVDSAARQMSAGMNRAAVAIEQASINVEAVTVRARELAETIQEIAGRPHQTRRISESAVAQSQQVSDMVAILDKSAKEIGNVTETITEISERTHLLTLNTTIEAARAGESGRGFAVLANEIKELAGQTAAATQDIRIKFDGIRKATGQSVTALNGIADIIHAVNDNASSIASAVELQSITTTEISTNVGEAALGLREITENIQRNSSAALNVSRDIDGLSEISAEMEAESQQVAGNTENIAAVSRRSKTVVEGFVL